MEASLGGLLEAVAVEANLDVRPKARTFPSRVAASVEATPDLAALVWFEIA